MRHEFPIGPPDAGRRIDRYVKHALGVPASLVQRLLRQGKVRLNGQRAGPGDALKAGDIVVVHHRGPSSEAPASVTTRGERAAYEGPPIEVLHEDPRFLVVAKPAGVSCSESASSGPSLPAWLCARYAEAMGRGSVRPEPCHRLDRDTTGVVVVGLVAAAVTSFHTALVAGRVQKLYRVVVWGHPDSDRFALDQRLRRQGHGPSHQPKVVAATADEGQAALTRFRVLVRGPEATLMEAEPVTGRTHQIRAHLRWANLPVVGDRRYGDRARDRLQGATERVPHQLLHAFSIAFDDDGRPIQAVASLPPEFARALQRLGLSR